MIFKDPPLRLRDTPRGILLLDPFVSLQEGDRHLEWRIMMNDQGLLHLLIGEWSGMGRGEFPTIEPFEYLETMKFATDGRPFLHYEQQAKRRTLRAEKTDYIPSHWESGFLRLLPTGEVELVNAQGSGRLERLIGSLEETEKGLILHLHSTAFLNDPRLVETSRMMAVDGNDMHYIQTMHTTAVLSPAHHVEARRNRIVLNEK